MANKTIKNQAPMDREWTRGALWPKRALRSTRTKAWGKRCCSGVAEKFHSVFCFLGVNKGVYIISKKNQKMRLPPPVHSSPTSSESSEVDTAQFSFPVFPDRGHPHPILAEGSQSRGMGPTAAPRVVPQRLESLISLRSPSRCDVPDAQPHYSSISNFFPYFMFICALGWISAHDL